MNKADCHCHTLFSDGSLTEFELLDLAKTKALKGLSITDHDSIAAYQSALPYAAQLGIDLISGIEISAMLEKHSIHVLGYGFDLHHPALNLFCQELQTRRFERNQTICDRLSHLGMHITLEEVQQKFPAALTIGRPHLAKTLVDKGYVKSIKSAFERYLGDSARCFVADFHVSVENAIHLIQTAGGLAVLAHPHYIQAKRLIPLLCEMPFDGIEAYYGYHTLTQIQPWLSLAAKQDWLITGGSDFHGDKGDKKSRHTLGSSWTPPASFALLHERFLLNNAHLASGKRI